MTSFLRQSLSVARQLLTPCPPRLAAVTVLTNYGLVVIHGLPDLHQPHDHEWFCPVAIEVMAAMAADRPKSRSQSSLSRKSSNSSTRKSSAPPVSSVSCKPHELSVDSCQ